MKKISRFITGAFLGALVSSLLVLLFTPKSGNQLRNTVTERVQNIATDIRHASEQKRKELEEELESLKTSS